MGVRVCREWDGCFSLFGSKEGTTLITIQLWPIPSTNHTLTNQVEVFNRALAAKAASTIGNSKTKGIQKALAWELSPLALVLVKAVLPVLVVNVAGAGAIGYMEGWTALDRWVVG